METWNSLLSEWAMPVAAISAIGTAIFALFVVVAREFFSWFLRLNEMRKKLDQISELLIDLEIRLRNAPVSTELPKAEARFPLGTKAPPSLNQ